MANITRSAPAIPWRLIGWGGALALLVAPFVAMQFVSEMNWGAEDFAFIALLVGVMGGLAELAVRMSPRWDYRAGFALGVIGMCAVVWASLAVGIVGTDDHPANLWFFGALLVGIVIAAVSRLKAGGMGLAMYATALALAAALLVAQSSPTDEPWTPAAVEWAGVGMFALIFTISGWLFGRAAKSVGG